MRIAHLSDPHFGTLNPGAEEALLLALRTLAPDLILITGDITQRARRSQFRAAKNFNRQLHPIPIIAIPGNHDIPLMNIFGRLFFPYWGFQRLFTGRVEKDLMIKGVQVVGLNSTSRWRHIQGDFKIPRIRRRFEKAETGAIVRIAAFHHPMDCAKGIDEKNLLRGRNEAMEVFDGAKVDLVVGGHIHDPYVDLSTLRYPRFSRAIVLSVAGTCLSWRTRKGAPNSFNIVDVETEGAEPKLLISRHDLREGEFSLKESFSFRREGARGWIRE